MSGTHIKNGTPCTLGIPHTFDIFGKLDANCAPPSAAGGCIYGIYSGCI